MFVYKERRLITICDISRLLIICTKLIFGMEQFINQNYSDLPY